MTQLPRQHAQLSTMVRFVRDEVTEEVYEISWEILPGGGRDRAAASCAQPDQFNHSATAAFECARQL